MQRDQRINDNWAIIYAQLEALKRNQNLIVVLNLVPKFPDATLRQYDFMLGGLKEIESGLFKLNIPFVLLTGNPIQEIPKFIEKKKASLLISDFNPLKISTEWKEKVGNQIKIPFYEVDAHNIIPCRYISGKEEYSAYTLRKKINKVKKGFLTDFPKLKKMESSNILKNKIDWNKINSKIKVNTMVKPVDWLIPGEKSAAKVLKDFIKNRLTGYSEKRNDPNENAQSNLSPYLHFGQISAQGIALEIEKTNGKKNSKKVFLEELIIRRELADNFCLYNKDYDLFGGFHTWAKQTLNEHRNDKREYIYKPREFENARTHDELWNAAQIEMVSTGKMHGFMRMYWAKKILEWTPSPEEALDIAIYLNDKYELDGRDPNGYAGIAWSIGGKHDRAWGERQVFGKIRFMNYNGCKRKFDVDKYIKKYLS
jgi:deoxyribodipyrimidine photo-lyase